MIHIVYISDENWNRIKERTAAGNSLKFNYIYINRTITVDEDGRIIMGETPKTRDTFATNYVHAHKAEGGDMKTLQKILGHKTYAMTADLYVHTLDEDLIAGMMRMDDYA